MGTSAGLCHWDASHPTAGGAGRRGGVLSRAGRWGLAPPPPPSTPHSTARPLPPLRRASRGRAGGRGSSTALGFLSFPQQLLLLSFNIYTFIHPPASPPATNIAIFRAVSLFLEPFRHFQSDFYTAATQPPRGPFGSPFCVCVYFFSDWFFSPLVNHFLLFFFRATSRRFPPPPPPPPPNRAHRFGHLLTT